MRRASSGPTTSSGSGVRPRSRASRCASVVWGPSSAWATTSAGEGPLSEASTPLPPRSGSRSRHTTRASTNAGSARMTKAARHESAATLPVIAKPMPAPTYSPARMTPQIRPRSQLPNQSPTSEATIGPAEAVTAPRKSRVHRSSLKSAAVALHSIAAPQVTIVTPRMRVRVTRSARTPNGSEATAPTRELTATSSPMSVFVMCSPDRSSLADAPTVAASAPLSPRIAARTMMTRVRSAPPSATVRRRAAALAAAEPMAAASLRTRWVRDSSVLTPAWWQPRGCTGDPRLLPLHAHDRRLARVLRLPRRLPARDGGEHRPASARRDGPDRGCALRRLDAQARDRVGDSGCHRRRDRRGQHRLLDRPLRRRQAPASARTQNPPARGTSQDRDLALPPPRRQGRVLGPLRLGPPHLRGVPRRHEPDGLAPLPLLQRRRRDRLGNYLRGRVLRLRERSAEAEHDDRRDSWRCGNRDPRRVPRLVEAEGGRAARARRGGGPGLGRRGAR